MTALNGPAKLFRNVTAGSGHLAGFKLKGTKSNRHGLGAEFSVTLPWAELYGRLPAWGLALSVSRSGALN
jgi:hypothetical protein